VFLELFEFAAKACWLGPLVIENTRINDLHRWSELRSLNGSAHRIWIWERAGHGPWLLVKLKWRRRTLRLMYHTGHAGRRRRWYDHTLRTAFMMMVMRMHRRVRLLTNMLVHVRIRVRVVAKGHTSLWISPTIGTPLWERFLNRSMLPIENWVRWFFTSRNHTMPMAMVMTVELWLVLVMMRRLHHMRFVMHDSIVMVLRPVLMHMAHLMSSCI
jgi:hypothetical protein